MPKIIPIRDLRDTGRMSQMCSESREPIFITKNGYGDMVIMSMAVYEESLARLEMRDKILAGKAQADGGDLIDGPTAMKELGKKHLSNERQVLFRSVVSDQLPADEK